MPAVSVAMVDQILDIVDMCKADLLGKATHDKITVRHLGQRARPRLRR